MPVLHRDTITRANVRDGKAFRPAKIFGGLLFGMALLALSACTTINTGPKPNQQALTNATSIKARALNLVDLSADPYKKHEATATKLSTDVDAAREFSAALPNNQISARQWDAIRDPQKNLFGGFLKNWKSRGDSGLPEFFRGEVKTQMGRAFDYLICLETNKGAAKSCSTLAPAS